VVRLTATEVSRSFSSVVNRVGAGEEIEVARNGVPIMRLVPSGTRQRVSAARWRDVMAGAPQVDDEFESDLDAVRDSVGSPRGAWPS